jgi:hypothetical protein
MSDSRLRPRIYLDKHPSKLIAEVLLRPYDFEIEERMTVSGALGSAESSLLANPERPVVFLFNMKTEDPIQTQEWRAAAERMLSRDAADGWLVVPVVPRLDAWALTDPRIKKDFETNGYPKLYADRAARIVELTRKHPFDPTELLRTNDDFRKLVAFLQEHAPQPAAATR